VEDEKNVRDELSEALREIARLKTESARPRVADDLLMLFGRIAGLILVAAIVMTAILALFRPSTDLAAVTNLLNTQLSLIIGAVLGYAAHPSDTPSA
jgi:hypothetical protein